jgi:hypothetical protein
MKYFAGWVCLHLQAKDKDSVLMWNGTDWILEFELI